MKPVSELNNTGVFIGLDNDKYHSVPGVSKSKLDMFAQDPERVMWAKDCPQDEEKLKTFNFGDAVHAICLEPERLKTDFVVMPAFNLRTNAGKEDKAAFMEENKNASVITSAEHKQINLMFESVMAHPRARKLIEAEGVAESSYFWNDKETGILCKCRPDKNIPGSQLLVDVKTTPDLKKFHYSVDDYRYYVQDAWYCDGVGQFEEQPRMEFLVIQKTIEIGRYPVMVVKLPEDAVEYGRSVYRKNLNDYADFMNSSSPPETQELEMSWRFTERAIEDAGEITL